MMLPDDAVANEQQERPHCNLPAVRVGPPRRTVTAEPRSGPTEEVLLRILDATMASSESVAAGGGRSGGAFFHWGFFVSCNQAPQTRVSSGREKRLLRYGQKLM
jgi:hypothetical protein